MKMVGPVETLISKRLVTAYNPIRLKIRNDSHLHSHHAQEKGYGGGESHFAIEIVSDAFKDKSLPARHRMIFDLLDDEIKRDGGIFSLRLKTKTPEEDLVKDRRSR